LAELELGVGEEDFDDCLLLLVVGVVVDARMSGGLLSLLLEEEEGSVESKLPAWRRIGSRPKERVR